MDLLFKRYASPFLFMDGMIQTGRFAEFVIDFINAINEEREEKHSWEFYLHKVWEGTYEEFRADIQNDKELQNMDKRTFEATVQTSLDILQDFKPKEGGEN